MKKNTIELTGKELSMLSTILYLVDVAMVRDFDEPKNSDYAYTDGGRFIWSLNEKEYRIFQKLKSKI